MQRKKIIIPSLLLVFVFSLGFSVYAQDSEETFTGTFRVGYRMVDTSGADYKYQEDINLDTGLRLFNFSLHYTPSAKFKNLFDRIDLNVYNFGGDPFETFGLTVQKFGKYKFQYDHKKSTYFYHDLHEVSGGTHYDPLTFNFERIMDSALFEMSFGKYVDFYLNFDRYTKTGDSTPTLDVNRIEFELDEPVKEESNELALGIDIQVDRYSLLFEERIHKYENSNSLFLPGYADGGPGARYPSSLSYFSLNQPYSFWTYNHMLKINARPLDNLLIKASGQISDQDMNLSYSEDSDGIDYTGVPFTESFSGQGIFNRKIKMGDFDLTYLLWNKTAIVGAARYQKFEQDGTMTIDGSDESMALNFETLAFEGGLQYQFNPKLAVTLGYRYETRDFLEGTEPEQRTVTNETESIRSGFFGNVKWDFRQSFKLTLDYQRSYFDGPYTLISPTQFDRFRATVKGNIKEFNYSASYLYDNSENEIPSERYVSDRNQLKLRVGYSKDKFRLSAGYAYIDVEHRSDRIIDYPPSWSGPAGTFPWAIRYSGESHLGDLSLSLKVADQWNIGGYANIYSNKGFWEIDRTTIKAYVEYVFTNGFATQVGYRYVNFEEKDSGFNDYTASILEVSFGYRWE
jgi:opacity protein-like surface antigen